MANELDLVIIKIACLREKMHTLIQKKENITDIEILKTSQLLDELLSKYYQIKLSENQQQWTRFSKWNIGKLGRDSE